MIISAYDLHWKVWVRGLPSQCYLSITKWPDTARRLDLYQKKQKSMIGWVLRMILSTCSISFHLDLWIDLINIDYDLFRLCLLGLYLFQLPPTMTGLSCVNPTSKQWKYFGRKFNICICMMESLMWDDDKIFNWTWYQFNAPTPTMFVYIWLVLC